jgi:ubiquinone/menaquinone biosynthesis C-methylase UbiE
MFTDREGILERSKISENAAVLEVGAGNGFFTEILVQKARKVYAVELQRGMVKKLRKRLLKSSGQVEILEGNIAEILLSEGIADVAFLFYSFHEFDNKAAAARNIARAIKKGGYVSIHEPSVEVNKRVMRQTVRTFEEAGFRIEAEMRTLFTRFARLRKI